MQLPQKQKGFSQLQFCIFEFLIQIWTFSKKDDPYSRCTFERTGSEKRA